MPLIESHLDPRVSDYSLLKGKIENGDIFVADNEKTTLRLLESDYQIKSVFCLRKFFDKYKGLIASKLPSLNDCYIAEKEVFEHTIGFSVHQGFMAIGYQKWAEPSDLSSPKILFNSIADSENIGSMVRTSTALGVKSLVFDGTCASPFLRRSVRVSMGTMFASKICKITNGREFLLQEKAKGQLILALSLPREGSSLLEKTKSIYEVKKLENLVLLVGNEATGIEQALLSIADTILYIPMKNSVDSLNVSHALAVALSHLLP